jgi:hypothetical protein
MTQKDFIEKGKQYVTCLFEGICEKSFTIAAQPFPQVILFSVKLDQSDYEAIKYSNIYLSTQSIIGRLGAIHIDDTGKPFNSELKLFDPRFEELVFTEAKGKKPRRPK